MISYLFFHSLFSLLLLALLRTLNTVASGLKFYLTLIGLCTWLLPLPLIRVPLPGAPAAWTTLYELRVFVDESPGTPIVAAKKGTMKDDDTPESLRNNLFFTWFFVAALLWAWGLQRHRTSRRTLEMRSREGGFLWREVGLEPFALLSIIPGSGAMTTGIWRPRVWIGEDHLGQPELKALLMHELTHVRKKDNCWIFALHWINCLFWWNPLVRLLSSRARFYLELRCDRACQRRMGASPYRAALAQSFLRASKPHPLAGNLTVSFISNHPTNMTRIKHIQRSDQMKLRHAFATLVFLWLSSLLFALPEPSPSTSGALQQKVAKIAPATDEKLVPRVGQPGVEVPVFTKKVAPKYPKQAIAQKLQGYVILQAVLREDGVVDQLQVLRGLGKGMLGFEDAAIEALQQWKFTPGKVNGTPADVMMTLKIDFVLDPSKPLDILDWSLADEKAGCSEPRALMNHAAQARITRGLHLSVPVFVRLDRDGSLLDWDIEESDLSEVVEPIAIVERVEAVIGEITWQPARWEGEGVVTDLKVLVPVSLKLPIPEK